VKEAKPKKVRPQQSSAPPVLASAAQRQAAAILEVLAGVRRPAEAAQVLQTSLPRYYQLERRALLGLLSACEPAPRGPRADASKRLTILERENRRLRRECDRQQALVRATERSLGLVLPAAKSLAKGTSSAADKQPTAGSRKRRARRPSVRALKAVQLLATLSSGTAEAEPSSSTTAGNDV